MTRRRALVLMKAMPPTTGHKALIEFASEFASTTTVLVDMASNEPMREERILAVTAMCSKAYGVRTRFVEMEAQSEEEAEDFWEQWDAILSEYKGNIEYVIGSEDYCFKIAEMIGARYIPFDPKRELNNAKATYVREHPRAEFDIIAPEFKPFLRRTITVFGAESTGKTTLSRRMARELEGDWIFEWARPYLETVGPEITVQSMTDIWDGQYAVEAAMMNSDRPFIVRDTDLYSTIGYWEQPHWADALGPVPEGLIRDANEHKADLYIITRSNIPFEEDPLRYGGDHRESSDEYWIGVAKKYGLNYIVLDTDELSGRLWNATRACIELFDKNAEALSFDRRGA